MLKLLSCVKIGLESLLNCLHGQLFYSGLLLFYHSDSKLPLEHIRWFSATGICGYRNVTLFNNIRSLMAVTSLQTSYCNTRSCDEMLSNVDVAFFLLVSRCRCCFCQSRKFNCHECNFNIFTDNYDTFWK